MKIVQSFWSKPTLDQRAVADGRTSGGWLESKFNYYSWALSCLSAREFYPQVELVTDRAGKEILIDLLKLPYTRVVVTLDKLNSYPTDLWALGKIVAYSLQRSPFIHIDSDVFLDAKFDQRLSTAPLVAQHEEYDESYYTDIINDMRSCEFVIPGFAGDLSAPVRASSAGIMGGNDVGFFRELSKEVFSFLRQNSAALPRLKHMILANLFYEQFFFRKLAERRQTKIEYLFPSGLGDHAQLVPFHLIPGSAGYLHMFGQTFKTDHDLCKKAELNLKFRYPAMYNRINQLLDEWRLL